MKQSILSFLLGVVCVLLVAETGIQSNWHTFAPAKPTSVVVINTGNAEDAKSQILKYAKEGYIVKSVSTIGTDSSFWYRILVVMEKY